MLKKLFYLILSVGILTFMLPNNLQAQSNVLNLQYTIYSQNPDIQSFKNEVDDGGFFSDVYEYEFEQKDIKQKTQLNNGLYRYVIEMSDEDANYNGNVLNVNFTEPKLGRKQGKITIINGQKYLQLEFREKILKKYAIKFQDAAGKELQFTASFISLKLADNKSINLQQKNKMYYLYREKEYTDQGDFLPLADLNLLSKQIVEISGRQYILEKTVLDDDVYTFTLKLAEKAEREIKISFDMSLPYAISDGDELELLMPDGTVNKVKLSAFNGRGEADYNYKLLTIKEGAIKLKELPRSLRSYYGIIKQEFDPKTETLRVKLGKRIGIVVLQPQADVNYNNWIPKSIISGVALNLADEKGNIIQSGQKRVNMYGWEANDVFVSQAGTYWIQITAINGRNDLDITRKYQLQIKENGRPYLQTYNGQEYALANPLGAEDGTIADDNSYTINLLGSKTLYYILPGHKAEFAKNVVDKTNNQLLQTQQVKNGDTVTFNLKMLIPSDHNILLHSGKYAKLGNKNDLSFADNLDPRLRFVEGSLHLTVNGQPTDDFIATYNAQKHAILLQDKSKTYTADFDFNNNIKLPPKATLELSFMTKVNWTSNSPKGNIINELAGEKVILTPVKDIKVQKIWQNSEGDNISAPLKAVNVRLYQDGQKTDKTYELTELNHWQITVTDLPIYSSLDQHKISYEFKEEYDDNAYQVIYNAEDDKVTIINKLKEKKPQPTKSEKNKLTKIPDNPLPSTKITKKIVAKTGERHSNTKAGGFCCLLLAVATVFGRKQVFTKTDY